MEVKILLLIIVVHTCSADSDVSGNDTETSGSELSGNVTQLFPRTSDIQKDVPKRSNACFGCGLNRTLISLPLGFSASQDHNYTLDQISIKYFSTTIHRAKAVVKPSLPLHALNLRNGTDLEYNKTDTSAEIFIISNEAMLFLKGLLVTRVMPSFYILLFLISLPLNALALVTFICKIKAKKPAVIYMSHLACVDLLFTLLLPLKVHYYLNGSHWVFSEVVCRLLTATYYCYMYCSILLMMCMSVDRLVAVVFPVASLTWRTTRKSMCVCVLAWLLAIAGTAPLLSIQHTFNIKYLGITCHDVTPKNNPASQQSAHLFSILSCLYFFLPLVVTLACYSVIIYVLSAKSDRLATTSSTSDKRRRAVIMTIAVVTEFVACFGPTNGILLYHCIILATGGNSGEGNASYMAYMFAVCVGSSSVFLDPLLYYYGSSQCRERIRSVLRLRKRKTKSVLLSYN